MTLLNGVNIIFMERVTMSRFTKIGTQMRLIHFSLYICF